MRDTPNLPGNPCHSSILRTDSFPEKPLKGIAPCELLFLNRSYHDPCVQQEIMVVLLLHCMFFCHI